MESEAEAVIAEARAMERQAMDPAESLMPPQAPSLADLLAALNLVAALSQKLESSFAAGTPNGALVRGIETRSRDEIAAVQAALAAKTG